MAVARSRFSRCWSPYQVVATSAGDRDREFAARADVPTVAAGRRRARRNRRWCRARTRHYDYRRAAFGEAWTDDNDAPGGHNGCDTRNDILDRDLVDKTYVCDQAVSRRRRDRHAARPVHQRHHPFHRGDQVGAAVQIDHIVPLALAWDIGARDWTDDMRLRFANDPANLLAVQARPTRTRATIEPALWMPPNAAFRCQYAMQFIAVLRGYALPVDRSSATCCARRRAPARPAERLRRRCRSPDPAGTGCRR